MACFEEVNMTEVNETDLRLKTEADYLECLSRTAFQHRLPVIGYLVSLALIGSAGNMLVIWVYWADTKVTATGVFILVMASLDMWITLVGIPVQILTIRWSYNIYSMWLCRWLYMATLIPTEASSAVMVAVAIDRVHRILWPLKKHLTTQQTTLLNAVIIILVCTIFGLFIPLWGITSFPSPIKGLNVHMCWFKEKYIGTSYLKRYKNFLALFFVGSISIMIIAYILIAIKLWHQSLAKKRTYAVDDSQTSSRVIFRKYLCFSFNKTLQRDTTKETLQTDLGSIQESFRKLLSHHINEINTQEKNNTGAVSPTSIVSTASDNGGETEDDSTSDTKDATDLKDPFPRSQHFDTVTQLDVSKRASNEHLHNIQEDFREQNHTGQTQATLISSTNKNDHYECDIERQSCCSDTVTVSIYEYVNLKTAIPFYDGFPSLGLSPHGRNLHSAAVRSGMAVKREAEDLVIRVLGHRQETDDVTDWKADEEDVTLYRTEHTQVPHDNEIQTSSSEQIQPKSPKQIQSESPTKTSSSSPTETRPESREKIQPVLHTEIQSVSTVETLPESHTETQAVSPLKTQPGLPTETHPVSPGEVQAALPKDTDSELPIEKDQMHFKTHTAIHTVNPIKKIRKSKKVNKDQSASFSTKVQSIHKSKSITCMKGKVSLSTFPLKNLKSKPTFKSGHDERVRSRTTLMMSMLTACYMINWVPHIMARHILVRPTNLCDNFTSCDVTYGIAIRSYYLNSAVNAFVYSVCSEAFRISCERLVKKYWTKLKLRCRR